MATAQATTNHDEIRQWVEARGGHPARVVATGRKNDPGILRIDFPGYSGEDTLEEIEWDEFFEWFDRDKLALLLSEEDNNRFNKFVSRPASSKKRSASSKKASTSSKKTSAKKATSSKKAATSSSKKTSAKKASSKKAVSSKKASTSSKKTSAKKASSKKAAPAKKSASKKATPARKATGNKQPATGNATSKRTTSHSTIRKWVEARGGFPAHVRKTGRNRKDLGVLRIDFPGYSGADTLERVDWDSWFEAFDRNKLAFLYQDKRNSRFSKLVNR